MSERITRRQALGGAAAVAAWIPPAIMVTALPAGGTPLSGAPEEAPTPQGKPLAMTGFDVMETGSLGLGAIAVGATMYLWARDGSKTWPVR